MCISALPGLPVVNAGISVGGGGCRYDSSLGLLTSKFVELVSAAPGGILDLNRAAESLNVRHFAQRPSEPCRPRLISYTVQLNWHMALLSASVPQAGSED